MSFASGDAASAHLSFDGVSKSFAGLRVLTDISFSVSGRSRTGLIGENGSGKSTLLALAAGQLQPDAGTITATGLGSQSPRVGLLAQEPEFPQDATVRSVLDDAVSHIRSSEQMLEEAAAAMAQQPDDQDRQRQFAAALERAELLDPWSLDARIERAMEGLGIAHLRQQALVATLSGGQRSRVALAALLLSEPQVLLLDEPTNHLDDTAAAFVADVLRDWRHPVLLTSHDREFLDEVATDLVDLDPSPMSHAEVHRAPQQDAGSGYGVTRHTGSYTEYLGARADARVRWQRQYEHEQRTLKRLRAGVIENQTHGHGDRPPRTEARAAKKFYADRNAKTVARRVNDVRSKLEQLEQEQVRKPPQQLSFRGIPWRAQPSSQGAVITATEVEVTGRLARTSFSLARGEHLLVTGENGSGKSTLLKTLAGILSPMHGSVQVAPRHRIGILHQDARLPDPRERGDSRSAEQAYVDILGNKAADRIPLSTFGLLASRDAQRSVGDLSRGQQQRLALAVVLASAPEILVLDEPTNHLALLLVTELEAALAEYPGVVVIASHDRWLRGRWHGRKLHLPTAQREVVPEYERGTIPAADALPRLGP